MKENYSYNISSNDSVVFNNNATYCIGTGRMNLALRHEYHNQLKKVQEDINFSHIRGHGLFCDDMAIYHTYEENGEEKVEYNFTYVDLVFDDYQSMGLKPFVELGFMPEKLASGSQTVFYWKGNVTPPKDYTKWSNLVKATINHWIERYGREEVVTWPFEVWNEPNLPGFWKDADMDEYFKLYEVSSRAVKECDPRIRVGGPAICGVDDERWLRSFLEYCARSKAPVDFVTRHAYATEAPDNCGHYAYQSLRTVDVFMGELKESRRIIDSFPEFKGMEMHITEFNTSYTPLNPIHDTNLNAAYVARLLSEMGDTCASYSYWTFGDVFEEAGVAFTPFSGCFGLLSNGMVPKPTYWTFAFFRNLVGDAIARNEHLVMTNDRKGKIQGVAWNPVESEEGKAVSLNLSVELDNGEYMLLTKLVDESTCNPLKTWIDMGSPAYPTKEQLELLKESAQPQVRTERFEVTQNSKEIDLQLSSNAVCYFELIRIYPQTDRGYQAERIRGAR
ncbi:MAG TPA: xylan 1,4-beta-xylosidase [Lachnospiraceae bacterium]|nr:xylan 1,4-beta-xylosidase [Lachnospiraceae bacterium]